MEEVTIYDIEADAQNAIYAAETRSRRAQRPRTEGGAGAVDKSTQTGIGLFTEEYEEEREAPWSYPRESTSSTELFRRPA